MRHGLLILAWLFVQALLAQQGLAQQVDEPQRIATNWTQVLVIAIPSIVTGLVTIVVAFITYKTQVIAREAKTVAEQGVAQSIQTHNVVNSRMEEMLRIVRDKSLAEGKIEGQKMERSANLTEQVAKTAAHVAQTAEQIVERVMSKDPQEVVVVKPAEVIVINPDKK